MALGVAFYDSPRVPSRPRAALWRWCDLLRRASSTQTALLQDEVGRLKHRLDFATETLVLTTEDGRGRRALRDAARACPTCLSVVGHPQC